MSDAKLLLGLIGAGIQRSLTPALQETEAAHQGLRLHYQLIDLDRTGATLQMLPTLVTAARVMGFAGLNITFPCKQAVIPLLDDLSDEARRMGAVNTVVVRENRLIGHNTDGSGWAWAFGRAMRRPDLSRVVLLGAGGAGSAIAHALLNLGADQLVVVDQVSDRARVLCADLQRLYGTSRVQAQDRIEVAMAGASGLIHATPTGMDKHPGMPLPPALLRPGLWVSEVVYVPLQTRLLEQARALGCATVDGGGMAVGQAIGAFELFTGRSADPVRMQAHFRSLIGQLVAG